jgi:hypothetical protein
VGWRQLPYRRAESSPLFRSHFPLLGPVFHGVFRRRLRCDAGRASVSILESGLTVKTKVRPDSRMDDNNQA